MKSYMFDFLFLGLNVHISKILWHSQAKGKFCVTSHVTGSAVYNLPMNYWNFVDQYN